MKIDLHVHTSTGSDGALPVEEVIAEAKRRNIGFLSITDHNRRTMVPSGKILLIPGEEVDIGFKGQCYHLVAVNTDSEIALPPENPSTKKQKYLS